MSQETPAQNQMEKTQEMKNIRVGISGAISDWLKDKSQFEKDRLTLELIKFVASNFRAELLHLAELAQSSQLPDVMIFHPSHESNLPEIWYHVWLSESGNRVMDSVHRYDSDSVSINLFKGNLTESIYTPAKQTTSESQGEVPYRKITSHINEGSTVILGKGYIHALIREDSGKIAANLIAFSSPLLSPIQTFTERESGGSLYLDPADKIELKDGLA
ncbi:MAG TPA: hypothetical protein VJJ72_00775 [Candidatus Paceibacterota bacterium]